MTCWSVARPTSRGWTSARPKRSRPTATDGPDRPAVLNFLLHRHLAERDLGGELPGSVAGPVAGVGAMLPDLWRMAHRRVRPDPRVGTGTPDDTSAGVKVGTTQALRALLAGIRHHLAADDAFHHHPVFVDGERALAARFRDAGLRAQKVGLFAHIGWELCLDGALLRRVGVDDTLKRLRAGLEVAACELPAAVRHHRDDVPDGFDERLDHLLEQVAWSDWVPGYRTGDGVARRLAGVRRRVRLPPFDADDLERLGGVFDEALDDAQPALAELLEPGALRSPR